MVVTGKSHVNREVHAWFGSSSLNGNIKLTISLSRPTAEEGYKGSAVRRLKWYMSWVQNVVRQFGSYPA